jgi:hypothetical protein
MVIGKTPTNVPYDANLVDRHLAWWKEGERRRLSSLSRPHPRDREWRSRFADALSEPDAAVQQPSFADFDTLAVLLQYCHVVVTNVDTIFLEALANDRRAVSTPWGEGAPAGERAGVVRVVLGEIEGRLADRVAEAIAGAV